MMNSITRSFAIRLGSAAFLSVVGLGVPASAQLSRGTASDFRATDYYDPPNETQMKWLLTGAEAQMQSGGRYRIKQLKLESFRVNGEREIIVEAPECLYDTSKGRANSAGRLDARSGDGRLAIGGEGFLWDQAGSTLVISNQIRSVIQRVLTNAPDVGPLVVTSRWFSFEATNRCAVFHDEVRGDDPELAFTCGQLAVSAAPGGEAFEVIEAGPSLVIIGKADGRRATADRAVYTRSIERVELIGNVTWQQGQHSGRADRAVVHRLERDVVATGRVAMKLPRESLAVTGMLLSNSNLAGATNRDVAWADLFADQFHSRSNVTVVEGAVRLVDGTNQLSCDKLTWRAATATAQDETATAEGNVRVERGTRRLRASHAVYSRTNATIVFTGEPEWAERQTEGRAESVTVRTETGEIHAQNQVTVKLMLGAQRARFLTLFPEPGANPAASQEIEVAARKFTAGGREVVFLGDVRAHQLPIGGAEPRLQCGELVVNFTVGGKQAESLQARENVVYEQGLPGTTNGPAMYRQLTTRSLTARADPATGALLNLMAEGDVRIEQAGNVAQSGRATYTAATDLLELVDNPLLETPQAVITGAQTLFWDRANARFVGTGPFKIQFKPDGVNQTAGKLEKP